jgi:hypothetical protein
MARQLVTRLAVPCVLAAAAMVLPGSTTAQSTVFRSHQSANLATTETLRGGNWLFEISHRFQLPASSGAKELWGIDGPAWIRLGLSWAPTDRMLFGVVRTNNEDNLELNGRFRFLETEVAGVPLHAAAVAGGAWNTDPLPLGADDNEFQAYLQAVVNARFADQVAFGVSPTFLQNPRIRDAEPDQSLAVGVYGQWYLGDTFSVLGEWVFSEEIEDLEYDTGTVGIEMRTRGHHFKLVATNQPALGTTQLLPGSPNPFTLDELRLGFNITRLLPF